MKLLSLLLLLLFTNNNGQNKYINFKEFNYQDKRIIDSLKGDESDKYLVFQTEDSSLGNGDMVTILFYQLKDKVLMRMITSSFIYDPIEIEKSEIFNYEYINLLGAETSEDRLIPKIEYFYTDYSDIVMFFL